MFTDKTVFYVSRKEVDVISKILNEEFENILQYFKENEVIPNLKTNKTEAILFSTRQIANHRLVMRSSSFPMKRETSIRIIATT